MSHRTARFATLGCKVNQYETQLVKEALCQSGYREVVDDETADVCVVNTCTVTCEADAKARGLIRQLAKRNPGTQTIVMGCYATREPAALASLPGVVAVVEDKRELPDVLQRFGIAAMPRGISNFEGHRRAFVKVQDGCLLNCTYCIIPQVRPGLRSRTAEDIEDEVRRLVDNGYREIVLTGIHLGHYGVETSRGRSGLPPFRLWHLIRRLDRIPGRWRLRLSSLEAAEVGPDFLDIVEDSERLCPHFHLCLQSGSDRVLLRMKRRYRARRFLDTVDHIRNRLVNPAFSTDVIVGFPGESEDDFCQTLAVCEAAGFMKIHSFPFSARQGTPAAAFPDHVSPEVKRDRSQRLAELEGRLTHRYHRSLIGFPLDVLVESKPARGAGRVRGTACRFAAVEFSGSPNDVGNLIRVRAVSVGDDALSAFREISPCPSEVSCPTTFPSENKMG
jgi:threonylcarbamoyladenosine tRNA methylthiotransferase MtaB